MVWRLTIEKNNGQCVSICGSEEVLRQEVHDWQEHENNTADEWAESEETGQNHVDPSQYRVRLIEGYSTDAARTPATIAYRFHDVVGMALAQL